MSKRLCIFVKNIQEIEVICKFYNYEMSDYQRNDFYEHLKRNEKTCVRQNLINMKVYANSYYNLFHDDNNEFITFKEFENRHLYDEENEIL